MGKRRAMWESFALKEGIGEGSRKTPTRPVRGGARFEEMLFESLAGPQGKHRGPLGPGIAPPEEILGVFHRTWGVLEEEMELAMDSETALAKMQDLVVYDIPDGTRSTLSLREDVEIGQDAGLFCLALVHTLKSLGAQKAVVVTHTSYNRQRGPESTHRVLKVLSEGIRPVAAYAETHGLNVHILGVDEKYELRNPLSEAFPAHAPGNFDAFFLVDYNEDYFQEGGKEFLPLLPDIDVCVRHTKMSMGGGWIPKKMLKSTFLYCQNGSLFSNWRYDELTALATACLAAKFLHFGEGLTKVYGDVDEIKWRHRMREMKLFHKTVEISAKPRKLFLVGSPIGVYRILA